MTDAFSRFSISLLWDFAEANPLGLSVGSFIRCNERIALGLDTLIDGLTASGDVSVMCSSASDIPACDKFDVIVTDPPYYQAVSYADLSDFFYSWLRGFKPKQCREFETELSEKEREFVQHIRNDKSRDSEKVKYERQMASAFWEARNILSDDGLFVCVFAHKEPDAWETLVFAIIQSGFEVTGSWPVQTEMPSRQRGAGVAALASSVWLVCRPRPIAARPGWDNVVLEEMRQNITERLHEYWDAGIRGADFVWAATGPALEAYSKHPVVKKANNPNERMTVSEFLTEVRRMVVDFIVGQVLSGKEGESDPAGADRLDAPTVYYLLHRHDFGLGQAPAGACILYATACGLSDRDIETTWDLLVRTAGHGRQDLDEESEETGLEGDDDPDTELESGSKMKLKIWSHRRGKNMGYEAPGGAPVPLIDRVHRLMHLWHGGEVSKVDEYLDDNGLRRQELFERLLQSIIELSPGESEERALLESISNHIRSKGAPVSSTLRMDAGRSHSPA